ncbi:hypothetical protein B0A55_02290 [Friedmanniomyces simplex]|uniref:Mei2-like C-terminal RNA recognition motif domain-containing protein n=1 Tax=Friedmanniomyces simplex TaxID=329884 RepID=A0A4U0XXL0_9PEZI|nr:hypothetical protein B0A55_02290 [Friedmanniomyces simplex]
MIHDMSTGPEEGPQRCHLLSIPREIRDNILDMVVTLRTQTGDLKHIDVKTFHFVRRSVRGISWANRRLWSEVQKLFYSRNAFQFTSVRESSRDGFLMSTRSSINAAQSKQGSISVATDPTRTLLCFGVTVSTGYGERQTADDEIGHLPEELDEHHGKDAEGYIMELPRFNLRHLLRHVELVLKLPDDFHKRMSLTEEAPLSSGPSSHHADRASDWLYLVRCCRSALGFKRLRELSVEIRFGESMDETAAGREERLGNQESLEVWVEGQLEEAEIRVHVSKLIAKYVPKDPKDLSVSIEACLSNPAASATVTCMKLSHRSNDPQRQRSCSTANFTTTASHSKINAASSSKPQLCLLLTLLGELIVDILEPIVAASKADGEPRTVEVKHYHSVCSVELGVSTAKTRLKNLTLAPFYNLNYFRSTAVHQKAMNSVLDSMPPTFNPRNAEDFTTDTNIKASIDILYFQGPSSLQQPGSEISGLRKEGSYIELPRITVRSRVKRMELILLLGFSGLKELQIIIRSGHHIYAEAKPSKDMASRLEAWVAGEMMSVDAYGLSDSVTILYDEYEKPISEETGAFLMQRRADHGLKQQQLTDATEHNSTACLLHLPPELRNIIWDQLTKADKGDEERALTLDEMQQATSILFRPRLACKQIGRALKSYIYTHQPLKLTVFDDREYGFEPDAQGFNTPGELTPHGFPVFAYYNTEIPASYPRIPDSDGYNELAELFQSLGWVVDLPPKTIRAQITQLHIELPVPTCTFFGSAGWYDEEATNWLHAVKGLKALGFEGLQWLVLELTVNDGYGNRSLVRRDGAGWQQALKKWVQAKVDAFGVAAEKVEVRIHSTQKRWDIEKLEMIQEPGCRRRNCLHLPTLAPTVKIAARIANILSLTTARSSKTSPTSLKPSQHAAPQVSTAPTRLQACARRVVPCMYDFSYLRIDFEKGTNVGYPFVNFAGRNSSPEWPHIHYMYLLSLESHQSSRYMKGVLDESSCSMYDLSYLRIDFEKGTNVGHAFVNVEKDTNVGCNFINFEKSTNGTNVRYAFGNFEKGTNIGCAFVDFEKGTIAGHAFVNFADPMNITRVATYH